MPEEKEKEQFDPKKMQWLESLEILLQDFEPAISRNQADLFWSTSEIKQAIESHFGASWDFEITDNNIYQCMLFLKYKFTGNGGCNLEWMLKRRADTVL